MDWLNVFSLIGSIVSILGFGITVYQIIGLKKVIADAEKQARMHLQGVIDLSLVSNRILLVDLIIKNLQGQEWALAHSRLQDLHSTILAINEKESLMSYRRRDFYKCILSLPQDLVILAELSSDSNKIIDLRALFEDLQIVRDNLTIIETHLKQ